MRGPPIMRFSSGGHCIIRLFKGADSTTKQELCSSVLTFLKGSKLQKRLLKQSNQEVYEKVADTTEVHGAKASSPISLLP